mgnify:CR=1 FL=1
MAKLTLPKMDLEKAKEWVSGGVRFLKARKLPLLAGAGAVLLLLLLLLVVTGLGGPREPAEEGTARGSEVRTLIPPEEAFLPNERERLLQLEEERYRSPRTPWEEELVEEFWNPVRETAIEALMEESAEEIQGIYDAIE